MDASVAILFIIFLGIGVVGVVVAGGIIYLLVRAYFGGVQATNQTVADRFGLTNLNPKGIYPNLEGKVDGIEVIVNTAYQKYVRAGASSPSQSLRAWILIRAHLTGSPSFQLRSRHQKRDEPIQWPPRTLGDPDFDTKFELFAPESANVSVVLPPAVKNAILSAEQPVHILDDTVMWTKARSTRDADLLINAIASCVAVARAVEKIEPDRFQGRNR